MDIKQFKSSLRLLLFVPLAFLFESCDEIECGCSPVFDNEYLLEASPVAELTEEELDENLTAAGFGGFTSLTNSDIAVYKIIYRTQDLQGNLVEASGLAIIPTSPGQYGVLSYQHGTLRDKTDAPSHFKEFTEASTVGVAFGSIGYIMSIPDYLGYGETASMDHPYEHGESLARASHDMLQAVYEFIETQPINFNGDLYLSGYSEGGFATMALHQFIEEESNLIVKKSAPGAGAYSTTGFAAYIAEQDRDMEFLGYYLWVLDTYTQIYNLNYTWAYYLNEPYASMLEEDGNYFNQDLSLNPKELFTEAFINDLLTGENEALAAALADNDYNNWKPKAPVQLWHGTADSFVPYFLSEDAFDNMTELGATIELKPVYGGEHSVGTPPAYFQGIYGYFRFD